MIITLITDQGENSLLLKIPIKEEIINIHTIEINHIKEGKVVILNSLIIDNLREVDIREDKITISSKIKEILNFTNPIQITTIHINSLTITINSNKAIPITSNQINPSTTFININPILNSKISKNLNLGSNTHLNSMQFKGVVVHLSPQFLFNLNQTTTF